MSPALLVENILIENFIGMPSCRRFNIIPDRMVAMVQAALDGNISQARELENGLKDLFDVFFIETNPIPIKTPTQTR